MRLTAGRERPYTPQWETDSEEVIFLWFGVLPLYFNFAKQPWVVRVGAVIFSSYWKVRKVLPKMAWSRESHCLDHTVKTKISSLALNAELE